MSLRWFGSSWGAPVCDSRTHTATPVGRVCARCDAEIDEDDQGVTIPSIALSADGGYRQSSVCYHLDCWLGSIGVGPRAHEFCDHEPLDPLIERDETGGFQLSPHA